MHIFLGTPDGAFSKPTTIRGTDDKPLIMQSKDNPSPNPKERIKSAPFPIDLNDDGLLDLVSGNSFGTFAFFPATEKGKFNPEPIWLKGPDGQKLRTKAGDSGPTFIDWDRDGDMDLISGSGGSGVFLFKNIGTKKEPQFEKALNLIPPFRLSREDDDEEKMPPRVLGIDHIKAPNVSWRVSIIDFNNDGKLDLIVGDRQFLHLKNESLTLEDANQKLAKWQVKYDAFEKNSKASKLDFDNEDNWTPAEQKIWEDYLDGADQLDAEYEKFAQETALGFVWLYLQN